MVSVDTGNCGSFRYGRDIISLQCYFSARVQYLLTSYLQHFNVEEGYSPGNVLAACGYSP